MASNRPVSGRHARSGVRMILFSEWQLLLGVFLLGFVISGIVHVALFTRLVRKILDLEIKARHEMPH